MTYPDIEVFPNDKKKVRMNIVDHIYADAVIDMYTIADIGEFSYWLSSKDCYSEARKLKDYAGMYLLEHYPPFFKHGKLLGLPFIVDHTLPEKTLWIDYNRNVFPTCDNCQGPLTDFKCRYCGEMHYFSSFME